MFKTILIFWIVIKKPFNCHIVMLVCVYLCFLFLWIWRENHIYQSTDFSVFCKHFKHIVDDLVRKHIHIITYFTKSPNKNDNLCLLTWWSMQIRRILETKCVDFLHKILKLLPVYKPDYELSLTTFENSVKFMCLSFQL